MSRVRKNIANATEKWVQERMKMLEADKEFLKLRKLVPKALRGKESGENFHGLTTDPELYERNKDNGSILLSENDMDRYEEFQSRCEKLARKYGLHWAVVEDLAMGVKNPKVSPRLSQIITARLDPIVFLPKQFDSNKHYIAKSRTVPPLAAIEIMRRVENLDQKTKDEIKVYLLSLFKNQIGCRTIDLLEAPQDQKYEEIEINVSLEVPYGYTAREVGEVYRKLDRRRREILVALGKTITKRRRQSKILMDVSSLKLNENNVKIYDIIDAQFGEQDLSQDQHRRKIIINRRNKGKKLIRKHLQS